MGSSSQDLLPPPGQLAKILSAASGFAKVVRECYWVKGDKSPEGFPVRTAILSEGILAVSRLEQSLNPHALPFGDNERLAFGVANWPELSRLMRVLHWISDLRNVVIELWQVHDICEGKPMSVLIDGSGAVQVNDRVLTGEWPPKLSEDVVSAFETAASQLSEYVIWSERDATPVLIVSDHVSDNVTDDLTESEKTILEAIGDSVLTGQKLADIAGFPNNSSFRTRLSSLVKRGHLSNTKGQGYRRCH